MNTALTVYFLSEGIYCDFFMRRVGEPEGLPPLYNTWNGYADRGHRVHIFSQDYRYDHYDDWNHRGKQMHNIPLPVVYPRRHRHRLIGKVLFRFTRLVGLLRLRRRVLQIGMEDPPDVIYSCSPWCTLIAWRAAKRFKAVHIIRRFGTFLYGHIQDKRKMLTDDGYVEALGYRLPFDLLVMGNDGTFGDRVAHHYGCPPQKLRFWTNGINKGLYNPDFDRTSFRSRLGFPPHTPLILALSRLAGWKRVDRVLEVMKYVKAARPDARLVIVGSGEKEQELKTLARRLAVDDVTQFVGSVEHARGGEYYNGCDVYLQLFDVTNRCNPLFEAMVCAMPVVTLRDQSTRDIVAHERTALLAEPADMEQAAQYVLALLQDDKRRRQLGAAAREHVVQNFQTWPERIEMEIRDVLEVLQTKGQRR